MDAIREEDAEAYVHGVCFKTGPPRRVGVELEWLVRDLSDPHAPVAPGRLDAALAALDGSRPSNTGIGNTGLSSSGLGSAGLEHGGALTREPGGQLELSSPPGVDIADCITRTAADLAVLREVLAAGGLALVGNGLEPQHDPPRVLDDPRYRAMEAHFDHIGPWGRVMMRSTASMQVNLDAGDDTAGVSGYRRRWELSHRLGPVLVAAFANSPIHRGAATGWFSTRQAVWARMEPSRTRAPLHDDRDDPREAWARYALDAQLLCIRNPGAADWSAPHGLTFRGWLRGGHGLRAPTVADLEYHLTTLFPPIRPRGWLELRMIDAQPGDGWQVAAAVATALLDDPIAADAAFEATEPLREGRSRLPDHAVWLRAARFGPADPVIGKAARACMAAARSALLRCGAPPSLLAAVGRFADQYTERGRCPAHDQLDASRHGAPALSD